MKKPQSFIFRCKKGDPAVYETDLLVMGLFSDSLKSSKLYTRVNRELDGHLSHVMSLNDFSANTAETLLIYPKESFPAKRILWVGLGEKQDFSLKSLRTATEAVGHESIKLGVQDSCLALHSELPSCFPLPEVSRICVEGVAFGAYQFKEYITSKDTQEPSQSIFTFVDPLLPRRRMLLQGIRVGQAISEANTLARNLSNRPANALYPHTLAIEARRIARKTPSLTATVYDQKKLELMGMGGILAVGQGSRRRPCLIELEYAPKRKRPAGSPTVALVGKAVTFDTGGISIKPSANLDQMKFDKSGGVAVLATMKAIAELGLNINVTALVPAAENMPGGRSYRPGDIVTTYNGKTVEILNTDAEGRMILCDAIALAEERKFDIIIDIATLTGACMVALGPHKAGLMSNDDQLVSEFAEAAELSGEAVWHLPSDDEYVKEMKSKIADLKNCGSRWGGACTAAAFLRHFVGQARWAHIDIAGVDVLHSATNRNGPVSHGFGVRLLTMYLTNLAAQNTSI